MPVIELSFARFEEFRALEKEIGNLNEALESRKVVERAKGVLMESHINYASRKRSIGFARPAWIPGNR